MRYALQSMLFCLTEATTRSNSSFLDAVYKFFYVCMYAYLFISSIRSSNVGHSSRISSIRRLDCLHELRDCFADVFAQRLFV